MDHSHHQHAAVSGFASLFDVDRFMPHGHCYQWDPGILWTSVIAAAYVAIPFTLVFQIMRKRKDLLFNWMFVCFGMFIVACGFTHIMEIITVWRPHYPAMATVKAITAAASVPTAIILFRIAPKIVKLLTVDQMVDERSLRLRAEAANEAKDRFIAVLSHELRTPLTPVTAGLDVLDDELRRCEASVSTRSARKALTMIRHNIEMEAVLINDLLDVSASGKGKLKLKLSPVDLREVVGKSLAMLQAEVRRKNISLNVRMEAERTVVMGASKLAELHGRRLIAQSDGAGCGAKFTLELPVADGAALRQKEPSSPAAPPADRAKPDILLVDDHSDTLRTIALLLRRSGYQVETAQTVEEAEALLDRSEVLISDIGLPDGNGWDLMARFKEQGGERGIAISGFGQQDDVERSRRVGFSDHLVKPIDIGMLRNALEALEPVGS